MSFDKMKAEELMQVADAFGVTYAPGANKPALIAELANEGVEFSRWEEMKAMQDEAKVEADAANVDNSASARRRAKSKESALAAAKQAEVADVLIKMERKNYRFEAFGKVFTKEHPYVICDAPTANKIFANLEGFRMATPVEVEKYYS